MHNICRRRLVYAMKNESKKLNLLDTEKIRIYNKFCFCFS